MTVTAIFDGIRHTDIFDTPQYQQHILRKDVFHAWTFVRGSALMFLRILFFLFSVHHICDQIWTNNYK